MAKSNAYRDDLLKIIFNATNFANIADSVSPAASLTVALHTSDPSLGSNDQSQGELVYDEYARIAVIRTAVGWTVGTATVSPAADIAFATMVDGAGGTVTYFSVGTGTSDYMLYSGEVDPDITVVAGISPTLTTATVITES